MAAQRELKGRRLGWKLGFLGASCWVPLLSGVLMTRGDILGAMLSMLCYALCLAMLWTFFPWRHPRTRIWKLYLLTLAPILLAAGVLIWRFVAPFDAVPVRFYAQIILLLPLFVLPVFTIGKKTWAQLANTPREPYHWPHP